MLAVGEAVEVLGELDLRREAQPITAARVDPARKPDQQAICQGPGDAVALDAEVTEHARPIDYNPCLECKLCVAACPVGAIGDDGHFNFSACCTHNYREFMGGFIDWVDTIAGSDSAAAYRRKVPDAETASIWQSLSFGANYKAAYCMAVCPASEEVISPFLADRKNYPREVVKPLQAKVEPVYVVPRLRRGSPCATPIPS